MLVQTTAPLVDLLRQTNLTIEEQIQIERAITAIAQERQWSRHTTAFWPNKQAFPENF